MITVVIIVILRSPLKSSGVFEIIKTKREESDFRESKVILIRFFRNED